MNFFVTSLDFNHCQDEAHWKPGEHDEDDWPSKIAELIECLCQKLQNITRQPHEGLKKRMKTGTKNQSFEH